MLRRRKAARLAPIQPRVACSKKASGMAGIDAGRMTGRERSSRGRQVAEVRRLLGEVVLTLD